MSHVNLSTYFKGVSTKTLTLVDAKKLKPGQKGSNQHEIGGPKAEWNRFTQILGDEPRRMKQGNGIPTRYIYLNSEQETIAEEGECTWYDPRAGDPKRSAEWRVYYQTNAITKAMEPGDQLFLAKMKEDYLLFIVVAEGSDLVERLRFLFGLEAQGELEVAVQDFSENDPEMDFLTRFILDEIGIEFEDPDANNLDSIIEPFGLVFPTTRVFSDLARQTLPEVSALDDPDIAIMAWLDHEEALFRRLEAKVVSERLASGWIDENQVADVDGFIKYSLSVQNRRKSRMGHSLEKHLVAVFDAYGLRYDEQKKTEKGKKPDFIFPGIDEYFDTTFSVDRLTMLAAKSTCKDRWPQVLPEAERIEQKHLVTLELGISEQQTETMRDSKVQLIVPGSIQRSYTEKQREWLWRLTDFVSLAKKRQGSI